MYDTSELVKPILIYNRFIFIWMFGWGGVLYDTFIPGLCVQYDS